MNVGFGEDRSWTGWFGKLIGSVFLVGIGVGGVIGSTVQTAGFYYLLSTVPLVGTWTILVSATSLAYFRGELSRWHLLWFVPVAMATTGFTMNFMGGQLSALTWHIALWFAIAIVSAGFLGRLSAAR